MLQAFVGIDYLLSLNGLKLLQLLQDSADSLFCVLIFCDAK